MISLYNDDCFNVFPTLEDKSIDLVLCDMPYGTTACKWDTVIDLNKMWEELERVSKPGVAVVLTASQPFTTILISSNIVNFKYCWVWQKTCGAGFLTSKRKPIKYHEDIVVFSYASCANGAKNNMKYNPQGLVKINKTRKQRDDRERSDTIKGRKGRDPKICPTYIQEYENYPTSVIKFPNDATKHHPTQKPVALMEYLIKTYSNGGDTVLDFCMGSGTTGVACKRLNRNFIGIEKEEKYFKIAQQRISEE